MSEIRFSRGLSLWQTMARGIGMMVFASAFVLLGDVLAAAGPLTPLAFALALLLLLLNLLGYVELALSGPRPGSAYVQVQAAEGGALGFSPAGPSSYPGWAFAPCWLMGLAFRRPFSCATISIWRSPPGLGRLFWSSCWRSTMRWRTSRVGTEVPVRLSITRIGA